MRSRLLGTALAALVAVLATALSVSIPASARATSPTLSWRLMSLTVPASVYGTGGAFFGDADTLWEQAPEAGAGGTLVNGTTGARTRVPSNACEPAVGGGPFLLLGCVPGNSDAPISSSDGGPVLYRTTTGQTLAPNNASIDTICQEDVFEACTPMAVGTDWIELNREDAGDVAPEHGRQSLLYENILTGQVLAGNTDPGGRVWDNLDARGLEQRLCSPLRVPTEAGDGDGQRAPPGPIQFYGRFAALVSVDSGGDGSTVLQECGHKRQIPVSDDGNDSSSSVPPEGNAHILVWLSADRSRIDYIELPSLQRGSWKLPTSGGVSVVLAGDRLFLRSVTVGADGTSETERTYSALLPHVDRPSTSR